MSHTDGKNDRRSKERRDIFDRREMTYDMYHPDRRSGKDRRSGSDRRIASMHGAGH